MSYAKLFGSILHSTIWMEPDHVLKVWLTMLLLADRDGCVEAAVPGLARAAGKTLEETEDALQRFLSPDKYSRTPDHDGRRIEVIPGGWRLLNYEHYRDKESLAERREKDAARQRRKRERDAAKAAGNATSRDSARDNRDESRPVTPVTPSDHNNSDKSIGFVGDISTRTSRALAREAPPAIYPREQGIDQQFQATTEHARALIADGSIPPLQVNPTHPALLAAVEAGLTPQELVDVAREFAGSTKCNLAYVCRTAVNRRADEQEHHHGKTRPPRSAGALPRSLADRAQDAIDARNAAEARSLTAGRPLDPDDGDVRPHLDQRLRRGARGDSS